MSRSNFRIMNSGRSRARQLASLFACAAVASLLLAGCATDRSQVIDRSIDRPAINCPERFVLSGGKPLSGAAAQSPLVDPRDGTPLKLVRSEPGFGDYSVPIGKYSVGTQELLRVESNSGRPLGVVKK
jgi:hypothetical protein